MSDLLTLTSTAMEWNGLLVSCLLARLPQLLPGPGHDTDDTTKNTKWPNSSPLYWMACKSSIKCNPIWEYSHTFSKFKIILIFIKETLYKIMTNKNNLRSTLKS